MWDNLFKRWIDLLFWWLPRNEERLPEKQEEGAGVTEHGAGRGPERGVEQQVEAAKEVIPDDLTVIKGIGPSVQEKLRSFGPGFPICRLRTLRIRRSEAIGKAPVAQIRSLRPRRTAFRRAHPAFR
jgi:hypothetical protein